MSTRARSMVVDGPSLEADLLAGTSTKAKVEVVVLDLIRRYGPITDDELNVQYGYRCDAHPQVPMVTPQRVRTARAALTTRGLVADSGRRGRSALGNPATLWQLGLPQSTTNKNAPSVSGNSAEGNTRNQERTHV